MFRIVAMNAAEFNHRGMSGVIMAARPVCEDGDPFHLAVSGGRSVVGVFDRLAIALTEGNGVQRCAVHVWFADERAVPPDHPDSNYRLVRERLIEPAGIPAARVHRMRGEDHNLERAAKDYEAELPRLDCVLLGLGEDGHIASLFPHAPSLSSERRVMAVTDAPKPPRRRITLGPAALREATVVVVLASGASKADAVERLSDPAITPEALPLKLLERHTGLMLVLDRQAARA